MKHHQYQTLPSLALFLVCILSSSINQQVLAFQIHSPVVKNSPPQRAHRSSSQLIRLDSNSINIEPFTEDEASMTKASKFMLESFWIPLSQQEPEQQPSGNASTKLTQSIREEFISRYGEIMGRRKLKSCLLSAYEIDDDGAEELVGIIGMDMTLIDVMDQIQYTRNEAEKTLTNAVASLGPKQRREYKDSSVTEIVTELLPPNVKAAVVISNLAVDPTQRKKGIGMQLCNHVEEIMTMVDDENNKNDWGDIKQIYLRVESDNDAARYLYEQKLGYECAWVDEEAVALRADFEAGEFIEIEKPTMSLLKNL